ncbi:hypothetical protein [Nocardia fluminea]|uniref:hypothetical protein n=1 Tax=Nocardia fluminea TaxID=134984 RepID=UPI00364C38D4
MTYTCTRPGCEIRHEGQAYCPTCTAEIKQNLAEQRLAQGTAAPRSCSPGACHGGHTIDVGPVTTRLTAVQAWMLAHDWTETSEGDSGWMWQHTSGRKVAVFRDLTDHHAWEGLIGRLAVAHARRPADIEREIRRDESPVPHLTDEHLRRLTDYVHPDEATDYVRAWIHSMATDLLTARARIAELEAEVHACDEAEESWSASRRGLETMLMEERHRVQVLAAQREPIGYACRLHHSGMRELTRSGSRENAEAEAEQWRSTGYEATVVELHEPRPVTE